VHAAHGWFTVTALDGSGRELATSRPVRI